LFRSRRPAIVPGCRTPHEHLKAADPDDLTAALAFALRFDGRKRTQRAHEIMAEIVAKRLVEHPRARRLPRDEAGRRSAAGRRCHEDFER
jgi:hypothetical protein